MYKLLLATTVLLISSNLHAMSFSTAKKKLETIYNNKTSTFYCGCELEWDMNEGKLQPNFSSCGYTPRNQLTSKGKINIRALRIEWEHKIPAEEFGQQLGCWKSYKDDKGKTVSARNACRKNSEKFKAMEGDLHNLEPAIGEINGDRSNFRYNMIEGEERVYGRCDAEVDFSTRVFEPAENIRGDIARVYFYFESEYGLKISRKQKQLFNAWDKIDPVDAQECKIHREKSAIMGVSNPFVEDACKNLK